MLAVMLLLIPMVEIQIIMVALMGFISIIPHSQTVTSMESLRLETLLIASSPIAPMIFQSAMMFL